MEKEAWKIEMAMWIDMHWAPYSVHISPTKLDDPQAKVAFAKAIKKVQDLKVQVSGRRDMDEPLTWEQLREAHGRRPWIPRGRMRRTCVA